MPEFHSNVVQPHSYPTDLTIPQFLLDEASHPLRPRRLPCHAWLVDDATGRSYGLEELRERVECLAKAIKARWNIEPGDVACLFSENHIDYPIAVWALHRLGAVVSCANPSYTAGELEYQLKETSARILFASPSSLHVALAAAAAANLFSQDNIVVFAPPQPAFSVQCCFRPVRPLDGYRAEHLTLPTVEQLVTEGWDLDKNYTELRGSGVGDRVALLSFSSGTTGLPKAIAIAHKNVIADVMQVVAHARVNEKGFKPEERFACPGDAALGALPLYHIYGFAVNLHVVLFCGMSYVVVPKFNLQKALQTIVRHRVTHLYLVPPMVVMLVNSPIVMTYDLSCVRFTMVAAAPLSTEVTGKFKSLLPNVRMGQAFGMTETASLISQFELQKESINGSAGTLLPDTIARIVKEDGELAGYDEPGELWVKGPQAAGICYSNNAPASGETFLPEGWVRTGDKALMRPDGNLVVVDRLKEMIKVNGYQVAPAELEDHLVVHPFVQDVGVVGVPDDRRGEVPLAFVVLSPAGLQAVAGEKGQPDAEGEEPVKRALEGWVQAHKARYKWVEGGVVLVDTVSKNPSGKILRRLLREKAKGVVEARREGRVG
ncbi:acetyl-CoA synthetase-like protein [Calocera viscosa TUFC12733]|uniref:Acetyl-CoA synthetase-like protein n=1 Tax=Calocera viscosa (strain TUFC12733) TaxID=1330018 RepID=A0A167IER1_CALVF|nr:acetyl-CoA synthetase-like protein [Calocera viscosa TUFC12733]